MENNIFEELYEDYKRVDVKYNKVLKAYKSEGNEKTGNFYMDDENNFYPSGNILDEDNKEYYVQFFDFDIEELSNISKEDIEIEPAKISKDEIEKGRIKVKEKEEVIEETQTEEVIEEPIQENDVELKNISSKKEEKKINDTIETSTNSNDFNEQSANTEIIEQNIKEPKENTTQEIINFEEFVSAINKNSIIDKELTELLNKKTDLTKELETLKEKYAQALRNGYNGMFKQGENTTDILPQIKEIEQQLNDIEIEITTKTNEKTYLGKYTEIINTSNLPKELKEQFIEKLNLYASISKEKEELEITKNEKLEELKEINERYKEAVRRASLLLPGENTAELFQQKKSLEEEIKTIEEELLTKENALKEIEDFIKENNKVIQNHEYNDREEIINVIKGIVSTIDLNAPSEEINQKLDLIEKHLIELNKLDQLTFEEKYNNAKTDEEKQQLISERENQVESYRDLLKHENKEIEDLLSERFNPLIDKFKSEIIKNKTKDNPEIPKEDPTKETEEPQQEIPKKGRLKVTSIISNTKEFFNKHPKLKLIALGLGMGLTVYAGLHGLMIINSALWGVLNGTALGFIQPVLHAINLGISKILGVGTIKFASDTGLYMTGMGTALYNVAAPSLITAIGSLGMSGILGKKIGDKIRKTWNDVKNKTTDEENIQNTIEEKEDEEEKSTSLTEEQLDEEIKTESKEKYEMMQMLKGFKEKIAELEASNKAKDAQIEMLKQQALQPEELEEKQIKSL